MMQRWVFSCRAQNEAEAHEAQPRAERLIASPFSPTKIRPVGCVDESKLLPPLRNLLGTWGGVSGWTALDGY